MFAYNGFLDDDDATKEAGTDFARRGDSAPRNSDDDADVADCPAQATPLPTPALVAGVPANRARPARSLAVQHR